MNKLVVLFALSVFVYACSGGSGEATSSNDSGKTETAAKVDDGKGVGEITEVALNNPLDPEMVKRGTGIYQMKCAACHKLTDQRVVGPGFAQVTTRRKPEWIMNMTTNVDIMLEEDAAARELLKECLVRMPNQNLSIGDARDVLEMMYQNDGTPVAEQ